MKPFFQNVSTRSLKGSSLRLTFIRVQPGEKTSDAAGSQSYARIGRSVIQVDRVSVGCDSLSAREDNIAHITAPFIGRFWSEDPRIAALQANIRPFQIEEREAKSINTARCGLPHAMVNYQPSLGSFNRR